MKMILFSEAQAAKQLIDEINNYVGSIVIADFQPTDDDTNPFAVLVPVVATSAKVIDLPSMVENKKLIIPAQEVLIESQGTLS